MPKEKLNKFMKERSGAAVTQKEADRLKDEMNFKNKNEELKEKYTKSLSGAAISEAERDRLKKVSRAATTGAAAEAMSADAMKNISGAGISDAERDRLKDAMPDYADGGEVVFGKGKDYIKDLL